MYSMNLFQNAPSSWNIIYYKTCSLVKVAGGGGVVCGLFPMCVLSGRVEQWGEDLGRVRKS